MGVPFSIRPHQPAAYTVCLQTARVCSPDREQLLPVLLGTSSRARNMSRNAPLSVLTSGRQVPMEAIRV